MHLCFRLKINGYAKYTLLKLNHLINHSLELKRNRERITFSNYLWLDRIHIFYALEPKHYTRTTKSLQPTNFASKLSKKIHYASKYSLFTLLVY